MLRFNAYIYIDLLDHLSIDNFDDNKYE